MHFDGISRLAQKTSVSGEPSCSFPSKNPNNMITRDGKRMTAALTQRKHYQSRSSTATKKFRHPLGITVKARRGFPLATARPFFFASNTAHARLALLDMSGIIANNCAIYMTGDDPSARMFRFFLPQASGTRCTQSKLGCLSWLLHLR